MKEGGRMLQKIISVMIKFFWKWKIGNKKERVMDFSHTLIFFHQIPQEPLLSALVDSYQKVFSTSPWNENWEKREVLKKIEEEIQGNKDAFLVLLRGDELNPVAGFSWGQVMGIDNLKEKLKTLGVFFPDDLGREIGEKNVDKILYFYDLGITPGFRGGLNPIRFLLCRVWSRVEEKNFLPFHIYFFHPFYLNVIFRKFKIKVDIP